LYTTLSKKFNSLALTAVLVLIKGATEDVLRMLQRKNEVLE